MNQISLLLFSVGLLLIQDFHLLSRWELHMEEKSLAVEPKFIDLLTEFPFFMMREVM